MVLHLLSGVQRRLRGPEGGKREDGAEGSAAAGGHHEAGGGRREPDLEGRKAEGRRDEEGKDPGNGCGAQHREQGSAGGGTDGTEEPAGRHGCICVKTGGAAPEDRRKAEGDSVYR